MSMPEWLYKDAVGYDLNNRSKRIVELIVKGYLSEKIESERLKNKVVSSKLLDESVAWSGGVSAFSFSPFCCYVDFVGV